MGSLVFDVETKDPFLNKGMGPGYIYAYNYNDPSAYLLGVSFSLLGLQHEYITDFERIKEIILTNHVLIGHNIVYDLGWLKVLFKNDDRFNLDDYMVFDTMLMAKLLNQDMLKYSLDACAKQWGVQGKKNDVLCDYVWESGLYQKMHFEQVGRHCHVRPSDSILEKFVKTNMDLIPYDKMSVYAIGDVETTKQLHSLMFDELAENGMGHLNNDVSELCKLVLDIQLRGCRVDLKKARENSEKLDNLRLTYLSHLYRKHGKFNVNSNAQIHKAFSALKLNPPKTPTGLPSYNKDWLREQDDESCQLLYKLKRVVKTKRDFIDKIIGAQYNNDITADFGRIHFMLKPFGAVKTGRFSSGGSRLGGYELNIQNIPARDPDDWEGEQLGPMCRELFLPEEGEVWINADYSNQEGRGQVHFAEELGCTGANELAQQWRDDPHMDLHLAISKIVNLSRKDTKTINLGLSYLMGLMGLARRLKLTLPEAKKVLAQYHEKLPFMNELHAKLQNEFKKNGFLTTLNGRKLNLYTWTTNGTVNSNGKDALNRVVSGSAADQTMKALIALYLDGFKIILTVHDEIAISVPAVLAEKAAARMKHIMETVYNLRVPTIAEVGIGANWYESK